MMRLLSTANLVYRFSRIVLYPPVVAFSVIPALKDRPYLVVAVNAMLLLWLIGATIPARSLTTILVILSLHTVGFALALLFGIIGARVDNQLIERKPAMGNGITNRADIMIALGLGFLLTLALIVPRIAPVTEEMATFPILVGITFVAVAARHVYSRNDWLRIALWLMWALGFVLLYISAWSRAEGQPALRPIAGVAVLLLLAYIFYDYAGRAAHGVGKLGLLVGLMFVLSYFVVTAVLGHTFTHATIDRVLRPLATLAVIIIGVAYWMLLSGRRPRWPWRP
jgi:hypothetical protein